jgi:hypothetical protein
MIFCGYNISLYIAQMNEISGGVFIKIMMGLFIAYQ